MVEERKRFVYEIPEIVPNLKGEDSNLSGFGFQVWLDGEFAILARKNKMIEKSFNNLQSAGKEIIKRYKVGRSMFGESPYHFIENSWLLHFATVPGNACDIGMDHMEDYLSEFGGFERHLAGLESSRKYCIEHPETVHSIPLVRYVPHNVDTFNQAMALRELFLRWANMANAVVK